MSGQRLRISMAVAAAIMVSAVALDPAPGEAGEYVVRPVEVTDYKAVFAQVRARDPVPARARIGGSVVELKVDEGSRVVAGEVIATIVDDKLALKKRSAESNLASTRAQLANARTEFERGRKLFAQGLIPKTRFDTLKTAVDVLVGKVASIEAEIAVIAQQAGEGAVKAPASGRVLKVPVTVNSVILPGEVIARIAGGGYFLRLALPERHAAVIREGEQVKVAARARIEGPAAGMRTGTVVKVYPELAGGLVQADVEVDGLGDFFVGERTRVWMPVSRRKALLAPVAAVTTRHGVDYVRIAGKDGERLEVAVMTGQRRRHGGVEAVEVLTGLAPGERIVTP